MDKNFELNSTYEYKLIYVMRLSEDYKDHHGLLKIGDASLDTDKTPDRLFPNCPELVKAANERIAEYTKTAAINYELLYTELAQKYVKNEQGIPVLQAFRDHEVHNLLKRSGFKPYEFNYDAGNEWYKVDLDTAKKAVQAVKDGKINLKGIIQEAPFDPIILRPEQKEAVDRTVKHYKKANRMLWNCKMRFGKTVCALSVVKAMKFKKTLIFTHRPDVEKGWRDDFNVIFHGEENYLFGSKKNKDTILSLNRSLQNYIYFASIQDLRGSKAVGGKFDKNDEVFQNEWDFIIIDEAHEGTTTELGEETIKAVLKNSQKTKFLALSGTPFNIMEDFDSSEVYTWDYIMEQEHKDKWVSEHFGDSNPYDELPKLQIYTYDLGDLVGYNKSEYFNVYEKAFNFREFFRVWTGDVEKDDEIMPANRRIGQFMHEEDIRSFLHLLTREDADDNYPFSNKAYRDQFRHTLWIVPGVKEAKALKDLMLQDPVFGNGNFCIINVAGQDDEESKDALKSVTEGIANADKYGLYTITLSCGKLTTGVTVKQWTAVLMLAGSYSTSAAQYLQTIFRVQSPCNFNGKIKKNAYVFDFAPDRTLHMVAEAVSVSTKAGKTSDQGRQQLGKFLNYCPVISVAGSRMQALDTPQMLQHLKSAYAERVVRNGFDDANLYNDKLLKLDDIEISKFKELRAIVGTEKAQPKTNDIPINQQGLTNEEYEKKKKLESKKKKKELTPEEKAWLEELKKKKKQRDIARSILRAISIRMPLLIYGSDVPFAEDITIKKFVNMVDPVSWEEFMPAKVTKERFKSFEKYYDEDIFIAAGKRIRSITRSADQMDPTERVKMITALFKDFKNPDKETVLTPWRTVNMHMGNTIGGYNFFDNSYKKELEKPVFIDHGKITKNVFSSKDGETHILEINSKTGLYPLYLAFTLYQLECQKRGKETLTLALRRSIWNKVVQKNIFIICKTPMAVAITKRTLCGYNDVPVNAQYFKNLVDTMRDNPDKFVRKANNPSVWKENGKNMKWNAIVGNPPYQLNDGGGNGASSKPIYHFFIEQAKNLKPCYISMISPSRWFCSGKGLDDFRNEMLHDNRLRLIHDYPVATDVFPHVQIKGGVSYFLWDRDNRGDCSVYNHMGDEVNGPMRRNLLEPGTSTFVRYNDAISILDKVLKDKKDSMEELVSARMPFGLPNKYKGEKNKENKDDLIIYVSGNSRDVRGSFAYVPKKLVEKGTELIDAHKVFIAKAGSGSDNFPHPILTRPFYGKPGTVCNESYLVIGPFKSQKECENVISYISTKFFRFLVLLKKMTQNAPREVYEFVPQQDFSEEWTDEKLYEKYNLNQKEIKFIDKMIRPMDI